ncbi:hypothetical protein V8C37DRAFT_365689 [Trichoderma ceciliae]
MDIFSLYTPSHRAWLRMQPSLHLSQAALPLAVAAYQGPAALLLWLASGTRRFSGVPLPPKPAAFLAAFQCGMAQPRAPYATLAQSKAGLYSRVRRSTATAEARAFSAPSCLSTPQTLSVFHSTLARSSSKTWHLTKLLGTYKVPTY